MGIKLHIYTSPLSYHEKMMTNTPLYGLQKDPVNTYGIGCEGAE
jgi:hypothetical protein